MPAQQHYNGLDSKQRQELLLKIGETSEEARLLSERDYAALGGWVLKRRRPSDRVRSGELGRRQHRGLAGRFDQGLS